MLVLSRKISETVVLRTAAGEIIRVTLVDTQRGKSRIGFDAPQSVSIMREELLDQCPEEPLAPTTGTGPTSSMSCSLISAAKAAEPDMRPVEHEG